MMYQKIIVPIDHGNRNLKTEQHVFTSGARLQAGAGRVPAVQRTLLHPVRAEDSLYEG